uniref:Glycosyl transferase family 9 n=1 Tax=Sphingobacterium sp. (strain 21) TaxID=743722 RepID=F4C5Y8_SPHS2
MNKIKEKEVKKIAVLRANALGDFLVTLPAIHALKHAYEEAEIVLLGSPWHAEFLVKKRTVIDRVVVVPLYKGIRDEEGKEADQAEIDHFFQRMQEEKFDLAIHFQGRGIASNPFISKLNARVTIGHTCREAIDTDYCIPFVHYQHEVMRYLELIDLVGALPYTLEPEITLFPAEYANAKEILQNLVISQPYIIVHPGAKDLRRRWLPDKFAQLADELVKSGVTVLFTGDNEDEQYLQEIIATMQNQAFYACRNVSLGTLGALFAKSELVVSNDTGPLHLARAAGAKTVGIYWAPNFAKWGPLFTKKHRFVISWDMQCPRCGVVPNEPYPFEPRDLNCEHLFSFVRGIEVSEVLREVKILLNDK